ncbi:hypothetical protein CNYM01_07993 [Colletotrichum nymphaeae SA-01]|uniref:Uncharacterized protein n=1 Tax=Colletotrichum nymphaeae SA-01 TaxID=1460502 RepID=A0A135THC0_9PEZI|nr:hypothetical protein CNYM01_07993 [Colletotrichum nymphaeae SA-01]
MATQNWTEHILRCQCPLSSQPARLAERLVYDVMVGTRVTDVSKGETHARSPSADAA